MIIIALLAVVYLVAMPVLAVLVGRMIKRQNEPHIIEAPPASLCDSWER